jgi:hypothetical protein
MSGSNGSAEKDIGISSSSLNGMSTLEMTLDLHGSKFGNGDDEASIIFIQNNSWIAANIVPFSQNGLSGSQLISIPLTAFHKVGDSSTKLDTSKSVTNLHARFWNKSAFTVDVASVRLVGTISATPTPTPTPTPTVTPTPTPTPTPTVTPTPTPTPVSGNLLSNTWELSATNGADEKDIEIPSASLSGMKNVKVTIDLKSNRFGDGDDEASIIFIQNNSWYAVNVIDYIGNGSNGSKTVTIPLSAFHKVGSSSTILDTSKNVSNLHARFWNSGTFAIAISNITLTN